MAYGIWHMAYGIRHRSGSGCVMAYGIRYLIVRSIELRLELSPVINTACVCVKKVPN
jgi:hypothetical protein